jgi:hypothetical protein
LHTRTVASRWRTIKKLKSNLVLVVAGCLLVLLAFSWRLAIAPALRVVATDMEKTYSYDSTFTSYAGPAGRPAAAKPVPFNTFIERSILSLPLKSTPSTALFEVESSLVVKDSLERLSTNKHVYAVDRKSARMVRDRNADSVARGYYLFFPFNTPRSSLPFWSERTGRTYPADYRRSKVVYGVYTYVFSTNYRDRTMPESPQGYPKSLSGAKLKAMLSGPDLPVEDPAIIKPIYKASGSCELLVEPRAGTIVRTNGKESASITVKDAAGAVIIDRPLYNIEYSQTKGSVMDAASLAKDELAKIKLQYEYIPLGLLVLGVLMFLIGAFAGVKRALASDVGTPPQ